MCGALAAGAERVQPGQGLGREGGHDLRRLAHHGLVAFDPGLDFIRAEGFAFAHVADEGIIESSAAELLRYRRAIGAEHVRVFADVKKKHSAHAITADVSITIRTAARRRRTP